jgi:hypothetical protein
VVIEKMDGTLIEARDNPEKSFEGHRRDTPWDDIPHTNVLRRNVALQCPVQGIWHSRFSAREAKTWRELCS